jgi:hypothetical protein
MAIQSVPQLAAANLKYFEELYNYYTTEKVR